MTAPEEYLQAWYLALRSEFGLSIPVEGPAQAKTTMNLLYDARKEVGDESLAGLSIFLPPSGREVIIYKKHQGELA